LGRFESSTKKTEPSDEDGESTPLGFYYYVPQSEQEDGASLMVDAKSIDTASLIDKRRRWMYTSYSVFIMTLPFTFASTGDYVNSLNAYYNGYGTRDEAVKKNNIRLGFSAASVVTGVVWVSNLIWYLHTASKVIPVKAKPASEKDLKKATEKSMRIFPENSNKESVDKLNAGGSSPKEEADSTTAGSSDDE